MSAFILLEADAFDATLGSVSSTVSAAQESAAGDSPVRRPYRGIQIGEDTHASIQVWRPNAERIPLRDGGGVMGDPDAPGMRASYAYANFVIQAIEESDEEKSQLVETFGEDYMFFFGRRPKFVKIQAVLMNSEDFNWRAEWWHNYNEHLRGSALVRNGARAYLSFDTVVLEGYLLNARTRQTAQITNKVDLSFSMWVTGRRDISQIGSPDFPDKDKMTVSPEDVAASQVYGGNSAVPASLRQREAILEARQGRKVGGLVDALYEGVEFFQSTVNGINLGLDYVKNVMLGKQVRVPQGFLGSELLTAANELASGTIPEDFTASGLSHALRTGKTTTIPGEIQGARSNWRSPIYESNWDEYARGGHTFGSERDWRAVWAEAETTLAEKTTSEKESLNQLRTNAYATFAEYGINPDAFVPEDALLLSRIAFGAMMLGAAKIIVTEAQSTESYLRAEAANVTDYHEQVQGDYDPSLDTIDYSTGADIL